MKTADRSNRLPLRTQAYSITYSRMSTSEAVLQDVIPIPVRKKKQQCPPHSPLLVLWQTLVESWVPC